MKIVSVILLILITTYVLSPCTDNHDDETVGHTEYSIASSDIIHSDVTPCGETCTPFCVCNCCSTQLIEEGFQINFTLEYTVVENAEHTFATIDQFIQPKVTPPKS